MKWLKHVALWVLWALVGVAVCILAWHGVPHDTMRVTLMIETSLLMYPCALFVRWVIDRLERH
jgi:hypothetical protein